MARTAKAKAAIEAAEQINSNTVKVRVTSESSAESDRESLG